MRRRRTRKNPATSLLLLGGVVIAAVVGGVLFFERNAKASTPGTLSPKQPNAPIAPTTTVAQAAAKAAGAPIPPADSRDPTMQDLIDSLKDPANFGRNHPGISFDRVTDDQLNAAMDALKAQQAAGN